jgi:hypothetical protein
MDWDWDTARHQPHSRRQALYGLELLEERWRVVGPTGRVVTCAVYRGNGPGVEVRAGYSLHEFHRTQRVSDLTHARVVAQLWRAAVMAKGLTELPTKNGSKSGRS